MSSVCYKCNEPGHFARECQAGGGASRGGGGGGSSGGYDRGGRDKCYKCNRFGHFARECKEDQVCIEICWSAVANTGISNLNLTVNCVQAGPLLPLQWCRPHCS